MTERSPLGEQCPATSKRTGERCQLRVIGGGPCRWHGGNAPQVRAAREARIFAAEALAAERLEVGPVPDVGAVLELAMGDAHLIKERLMEQLVGEGYSNVAAQRAASEAIDRASRTAKAYADAGVDERRARVAESQVRLAESQGQLLARVVQIVLAGLQLTAEQQALVPTVVPAAFREIGRQQDVAAIEGRTAE
ncbi:hypothetical protein [Aeromicrobium sp. CnD17-E]|uniref:hypothetical protein n=1 Tax=Aeromicrobium sp. CnD17-E TaxID=2954487 RepID=UPI002097722D|nr:hypothetical protein [Aeromicrobium sp. CnD17-E]MCO7238408.1 hypothetical protein [Aeromicrobium sp. CnD17-E]